MASDFEYAYQGDTSYYIKKYGIGSTSEGNCCLNAMFNVMRDWGKQGYIDVPYSQTEDINDSILNDILYETYGNGTKTGEDEYGKFVWTQNKPYILSKMPVLYSDIRSYAINNGYTVSGYPYSKLSATMEYVANILYGNNLGVEHTTSISEVTTKIYTNRCSVLTISNSGTYSNHAVAVIGYHKYSKEKKINDSFSIVEYKYFYEIADGWHYTSKIFDPNTPASPILNFYYLARC